MMVVAEKMERVIGIEPMTTGLEDRCSTAELRPQTLKNCQCSDPPQ